MAPPVNKKSATSGVAAKEATHLSVRALVSGFRRAGRAWSVEAEEVAISEFTDDQVTQLLAEPNLSVVLIVKAEADKKEAQ